MEIMTLKLCGYTEPNLVAKIAPLKAEIRHRWQRPEVWWTPG